MWRIFLSVMLSSPFLSFHLSSFSFNSILSHFSHCLITPHSPYLPPLSILKFISSPLPFSSMVGGLITHTPLISHHSTLSFILSPFRLLDSPHLTFLTPWVWNYTPLIYVMFPRIFARELVEFSEVVCCFWGFYFCFMRYGSFM